MKAPLTGSLTTIALPGLALTLLTALHVHANSLPLTADVVRPGCMQALTTERATIARVTDGDTVVLTDQRRVRLIGINSAELNAKNPTLRKAAQQATDALENWLPSGQPVVLYLGDEPHDRHGRVLAHVVRESDNLAVAHLMVKQGLAVQSAVAPTTRCTDDFEKLEQQAIKADLGLWTMRNLMSTSAKNLTTRNAGFKLINGLVTSVNSQPHRTELFLDKHLQLLVRPALAKQLSLKKLSGQRIEVRGWVSRRKGQPYLWLQHAANLTTLDN